MSKNNNRDDFSKKTIESLGKRVNYLCSNPECRKGTVGPASSSEKFINTGVASHICAAAPGGKRYDPNMTPEQRSSIENGIWLCQICSKIIDSDEEKYTVEILKEWKEKAELRAGKGLINSIDEIVELEKDNLIKKDEEDNIDILNIENKFQWNSIEYKEYIKKFDELKDYIYCIDFANFFQKEFKCDNVICNFGKEIIDWTLGKKKFPLADIEDFYKELKLIYKIDDNSILSKRWKALKLYFEGKIKESHIIYLELLNMKENNIEDWLRDDILVDGRNITIQLERAEKKYSINNVFQMEIEKNNRKIVYPSIDRVRSNLYENVLKNVFNYQNKSKYTQIYGVGLEYILNSIQELIYISILYGSITHFRLVRNLLSEVLSIYANCYGDSIFYKNSLKLMILSGKFKEFKTMYNKIKFNESFSNSNEFIKDILAMEKSILPIDTNNYYVFIFDIYGRYLNEKDYMKFEKRVLKIINIGKTCEFSEVNKAWESIPNNIDRFEEKEKLFSIILKYINKNYSGFYRNFNNIINKVKFIELSENQKELFMSIVNKTKDIKEIETVYAMIALKKYTKTKNYDDILLKEGTYENFLYNIDKKKYIETMKFIVKELENRAREREKNPAIHHGYGVSYTIGWDSFTKRKYNEKVKEIVINDILPLAKIILLSENQYANEKINMIKYLTYVSMVEEDKKIINDIEQILGKIVLKSAKKDFYEYKSEEDILINIKMLEWSLKKKKTSDLINEYLLESSSNKEVIYEIIDCIGIIHRNKIKISDNDLNMLYSIYTLAIQSEDLEIIDRTVQISDLFIDTKFSKDIIHIFNKFIEDNNFEKDLAIANFLYCLNRKNKIKFQDIINKLGESTNYNIRYVVNKYLKGGK